ncbi:hypothetical protein LCGC14_1046130 [marine sediment metagenome]|uniref:Uncharacterized protein n=1 Tax=marine sediment metagenome TaxID=412755 RepID=A0A0F9Q8E2_9ZZZZ
MNLTEPGKAEDITTLGKFYEDHKWNKQDTHDDLMTSYLTMKNAVDVYKAPNSKSVVEGFRSGIGGMLVEQDASLLISSPQIHFRPADPEDEDERKYIDSVLEPWASGAWKRSQQAMEVWRFLSRPLIGLSRAWDNILPHPHLWSGTAVAEIVERLNDEKDHKERTKLERQIKRAKTNIWPIRWTSVPTRKTYTDYGTEYHLPEVIESRMMTTQAIVNRWGEKALPGPFRDRKKGIWPIRKDDTTEIKVYVWANHNHSAVVIPHDDDPKLVADFEHGFGRSPYECAIDKMLLDNDLGIMFPGALFYVRNIIDAYDELLSDYRELHRDHARTERVVHVGRLTYDPSQLDGGRPVKITIEDGMTLFDDEKVDLIPLPEIGKEKYAYLVKLQDQIREAQRSGVLRGEILSGTSQNAFTTAYQVAERELEPATKALAYIGEAAVERFLLSVKKLDEPVAIFTEKGMVEVKPDDTEWIPAIKLLIGRAIPIDLSILTDIATRLQALGLSPETWMSALNLENPGQELRMAELAELRAAIHTQIIIPAVLQRLQQPAPFTPEQVTEIEGLMGNASPDLSQFLESQVGEQLPGPIRQVMANQARQGIPQATQRPQEVTGGTPVGV